MNGMVQGVIMALCVFLVLFTFVWLASGFLGRIWGYIVSWWMLRDDRDESRALCAIPGVVLVDGFNRLLDSPSDTS